LSLSCGNDAVIVFGQKSSSPAHLVVTHAITRSPLVKSSPLPTNPELFALEQQYQTAIEKQVMPAVTEYAKTILASYRNALDRAARTPGISSAEATALRAETQRLAIDPKVPDADPPGTPQALTTLRNTFRQAVAAFRSEKEAPLKTIYDKQVADMRAQSAKDPTKATKDAPFINSLDMKFVPVPGTKVLMCIHETRKGDYATFASQNAGVNADWNKGRSAEDFPVVYLNRNDARSFCDWLSQKEGIKYRLPTDREWSVAVGLGSLEDAGASPEALGKFNTGIYTWGTSWPPPNDAGNFWDNAINDQLKAAGQPSSYKDGYGVLAPVMSFPANSLGLHDLGGNACEYCEDWFNSNQKERVRRGSSGWTGRGKAEFRSSVRGHNPPDFRSRLGDLGFRCVVVPGEAVQASNLSTAPSAVASKVVPPTATPPVARRGGVDRFDSARFSSGLVMFETNLESQIMPAASNSYTPLLLQELYTACVELEIEQCQKTTARAADLSWFEAERERVRNKSYPNGSNEPAQPDRLRKLREAYWQAAVEIDRRLDAQKK
jgi:hypothetical protein